MSKKLSDLPLGLTNKICYCFAKICGTCARIAEMAILANVEVKKSQFFSTQHNNGVLRWEREKGEEEEGKEGVREKKGSEGGGGIWM